MDWIGQALNWYLYLFIIGLIFFPISRRLFGSFFDTGYAFSKTLGILILTYSTFILGITKLLAFSQLNSFLLLIFFGCINTYLYLLKKFDTKTNEPVRLGVFLFEELLFIISLFFLSYIRGQEPSIHGLEKFMDFGFMKSILRSEYFPPLDMWLSSDAVKPEGYPINYYYFGHLTGSFLIQLSNTIPTVGYNLILATIFANGVTLTFSIVANCVYFIQKHVFKKPSINHVIVSAYGLLGTFIVNLGGNLHTIYLFTKGYPNENPVPFWQILSDYNPTKYWYPNATRFIPFTIHEFPSYSYVVADLHGHVFDIPFVLLSLALLMSFFLYSRREDATLKQTLPFIILMGFMSAIHYMTNAFDGPIYLLLTIFIIILLYRIQIVTAVYIATLFTSFLIFSFPFSYFFAPFVSGVGVNCSPGFLVDIGKLGPFIFEKGKCQVDAPWMLFVLWGFFWTSFAILIATLFLQAKQYKELSKHLHIPQLHAIDLLMVSFFAFGTFLIMIPEFFYIKDIYPDHFRANTMFKLGYQAFMIMGISSTYALYRTKLLEHISRRFFQLLFLFLLFFVFIYPFFSFPSYYGKGDKKSSLLGDAWLITSYPEDWEIVSFFDKSIIGQPTVLEAQGDSYTDYERISTYTGLPTVAGWWVHEWLWRGSADIVGKRIPDITIMYESNDIAQTLDLLRKYKVKYVVVSGMERTKYPKLNEKKFSIIGTKIFTSSNQRGAVYQIN